MVFSQEQLNNLDGKSLIQIFNELANMVVVNVEKQGISIPIYASFYVLMGQYFKDIKIGFGSKEKDLRLNFFWVQNSRTGKGEHSGVAKQVATGLGIRWTKVTKITDAGLLGSIDQFAIEYNYKNKLSEDDDRWKNPVVVGDLGNFDLIFFDECKQLLEPQVYNENSMQIMQEALDYPGHVRSKLRFNVPIEYDCSCSIYATTYYLGKSIETSLLGTGFFQRNMPYMKDVSIEENNSLRRRIIQKFNTSKKNQEVYNDMLNYFIHRVKSINNSPRIIYLDNSAISELDNVFSLFNEEIKKSSGEALKILMSFSQTVIDICTKIGGINSIIEERAFINASNISSSYIMAKSMSDTIINKLSLTEQKTDNSYNAKRVKNILILSGGKLSTSSLVDEVRDKLEVGRRKAHALIKKLINENYLREELGDGNTKFILPAEDLR